MVLRPSQTTATTITTTAIALGNTCSTFYRGTAFLEQRQRRSKADGWGHQDGQAWEVSWVCVSCRLACRRFHAACHATRKVPRRSVTLHSSHLRRACPCHAPGCRRQTVFPLPPSVPATWVHVPPLLSSHLDSAAWRGALKPLSFKLFFENVFAWLHFVVDYDVCYTAGFSLTENCRAPIRQHMEHQLNFNSILLKTHSVIERQFTIV